MHSILMWVAAIGACGLLATVASGQSAKEVRGASALNAIENEAPAKLIVDPPNPESLAMGHVFIQYRTENLRVVPVALSLNENGAVVSPRRH